MALPPAMSARRWSCRRTARTITAMRPGGSRRHREPIAFRWLRSRSARWSMVCLGQVEAALVDKGGGALGVFGFGHTLPTSPGGTAVTPGTLLCRSRARGVLAVGEFAQPAAFGELGQLSAQGFELAPHPGVQAERLADLTHHHRTSGGPYGLEDPLVLRRQSRLGHAGAVVRDQQHRLPAHLGRGRFRCRALGGDLLAHPREDPLGQGEVPALGRARRARRGHHQRGGDRLAGGQGAGPGCPPTYASPEAAGALTGCRTRSTACRPNGASCAPLVVPVCRTNRQLGTRTGPGHCAARCGSASRPSSAGASG